MYLRKLMLYLIATVAFVLLAPAHAQENTSTLVQQSGETQAIAILAKQNLALHSRPNFYSNVLGVFESGENLVAFGRIAGGEWLQTEDGWVNARNAAANGDIMSLPITTEHITLQATGNRVLRDGPDPSFGQTASLADDKLSIAVGRNHDGSWVQTPGGWLPSNEVETDGDVSSLPVTFASITVTAAKNGAFLNAPTPTWDANVLEIFERGNEAFAHRRTDDGRWVRTPKGWLNLSPGMEVQGDLMAVQVESIATVTLLADAPIFARPQDSSDVVGTVEKGEKAIAINATADGTWIEIPFGWISRAAVEVDTNLDALTSVPVIPAVPEGIRITPNRNNSRVAVRTEPSISANTTRYIVRGDEEIAICRNRFGTLIMVSDGGWVLSYYFEVDGDIRTLPVFDGTGCATTSGSTVSASAPESTPTPTPKSGLSPSTIRTLVSRHTDDIRILDIDISGAAITIDYDLKPWPFVPNESIANEVAFKIICALRRGQQIPNTLKLIGQGHFKSDIGRKFKSPSVEIHISARNANRIVCSGNNHSDINWRSVSSRYKSYPIPRGASVDYD